MNQIVQKDRALVPLPDSGGIHVVGRMHPLNSRRVRVEFPYGTTILEIVRQLHEDPIVQCHVHVHIGPHYIPRDYWHLIRPKSGTCVAVRVWPTGGGGGGKKNPLRTVLTIAIIAASIYLGSPLFLEQFPGAAGFVNSLAIQGIASGSQVLSGIVGLAGLLITNMIAPPPKPKLDQLSARGERDSPTLFITGTRNRPRQFGVVPRLLGVHRVLPDYGALPYTEIVGDDQYVRALFCFGYGPLKVEDEKLGETALTEYVDIEQEFRRGYQPSQLTDKGSWDASTGVFPVTPVFGDTYTVSVEGTVDSISYVVGDTIVFNGLAAPTVAAAWDKNHNKPLTLWPDDVFENSLQITLTEVAGPVSRTSKTNADELSVDLTFPRGLVNFDSQGNRGSFNVQVRVEYSPVGAGVWTEITVFDVTGSQTNAVRKSHRWKVTRGQYDVRLTRLTGDTDSSQIFDQAVWSALRTFTNEDPIRLPGMCVKVVRIRASDQLSGVVDEYNAVASSILKDWDSGTSSFVHRVTSNPASHFLEVLQGAADHRPLVDSRIDLDTIKYWHGVNVANGREFNLNIDFKTSVFDLLRDICAAGRAGLNIVDSKWSVAIDEVRPIVVQHFTPVNSWGFSVEKIFPDDVHGWRTRFINRNVNWEHDERIVYDDGFNEDNATKLEELQLVGITDPTHVFKDARYHIATVRLRPETYSFFADPEYLVCTKGDRIKVAHDVTLWGTAWGRVKAVEIEEIEEDVFQALAVEVDSICPMESGHFYNVRFRLSTGDSVLASVQNVIGENLILTFITPIPHNNMPDVGDLFMFGETGVETADLIVKGIQPTNDMNAKLICLDYAPAVFTADQGTIPVFQSLITPLPGSIKPLVDSIRSDESVLILGANKDFTIRVLVTFGFISNRDTARIRGVQAAYRPKDSGGPWQYTSINSGDARDISIFDVDVLITYELRFRYIYINDTFGPWTALHYHTVVGASTPPPDVVTLLLQNDQYAWTYDTPPRDHDGFVLKFHYGINRNFDTATEAHPGVWADSPFPANDLPKGVITILVKAVDLAGNLSVTPAVLVRDLGDPLVANLIDVFDLAAAGFPGSIIDGTVVDNILFADEITETFWTANDNNLFWSGTDNNDFWKTIYKTAIYEFMYVPDITLTGSRSKLLLQLTVEAMAWQLDYRSGGEGLFWSFDPNTQMWQSSETFPAWSVSSELTSWPGQLTGIRREEYTFRLTMAGSRIQGKCSEFKVLLDAPDERESFEDITIPVEGIRLPITKTYRKIKLVGMTMQQNEVTDADRLTIVDKDHIQGPRIVAEKFVDSEWVAATALIDAEVLGVAA
jgi:hypothetical protein